MPPRSRRSRLAARGSRSLRRRGSGSRPVPLALGQASNRLVQLLRPARHGVHLLAQLAEAHADARDPRRGGELHTELEDTTFQRPHLRLEQLEVGVSPGTLLVPARGVAEALHLHAQVVDLAREVVLSFQLRGEAGAHDRLGPASSDASDRGAGYGLGDPLRGRFVHSWFVVQDR